MSHESVFPVNDPAYGRIYAQESAMVDASELIARALETSGMSRSDLARALDVNRSEVTARLAGERNITVRKLAETLHVLGERLVVATEPITQQPQSRAHEWKLLVEPSESAAPVGKWIRAESDHVS